MSGKKYKVIVTAAYGDGDLLNQITHNVSEEDLNFLKLIAELVEVNGGLFDTLHSRNHPEHVINLYKLTNDEYEKILGYLPNPPECEVIYSIDSIIYHEEVKEFRLL